MGGGCGAKGSTANPEWCLALVEDAKMLQPASPCCEVLGEPSAAPSGGNEPHRNFERWQAERAVEKERMDALAAAGVADGTRYARPGDDGPVGVVRMMGTGALEPVVGLREQRRRKIAEVEAAAVAAAERDAAAARGDAEEEPAASPKALAPPAADSAGAAVQTALERVVAACALAGLELSLGDA